MISVIVPVYNVEEYLEACLNSIIHQSEKDLEIIVINDGSKDNSASIAKRFAENDKRIRFIEQENQGLSITRNNGIEVSTGEYIMFIDSDDFIDLDCVSVCLDWAKRKQLSVISFDAETFNETENSFTPSYDRKVKMPTDVFNGVDFLMNEKKLVGHINNSSAMKFIERKLLMENDIRFKPYILQEDILFNYQIMLASDRVAYAPYPFYKRRIREGSIMTTAFKMRNLNSYQVTLNELANILCSSDRLKRLYFAQLFDIFGFALKNVVRSRDAKNEMLKKLIVIFHQIPSFRFKLYLLMEIVFRAFMGKNAHQVLYKVK